MPNHVKTICFPAWFGDAQDKSMARNLAGTTSLISAAPDLLHELKHMIQLILDHCDDLQGTPLPVALANATTLIQQTEGR